MENFVYNNCKVTNSKFASIIKVCKTHCKEKRYKGIFYEAKHEEIGNAYFDGDRLYVYFYSL